MYSKNLSLGGTWGPSFFLPSVPKDLTTPNKINSKLAWCLMYRCENSRENLLDARNFHSGGTWFSRIPIQDLYEEQSTPQRK